jgi:hypothetical protein
MVGSSGADDFPVQFLVTEMGGDRVACRIHLRDSAGKPVLPSGFPVWRDHFVCDGSAALKLAPQEYRFEVERGPEYLTATGHFNPQTLPDGTLRITLERLVNMPAQGWWPGDLHVHRKTGDIELLMRAEDLRVAPVITWWNNRNLWSDRKIPEPTLNRFDTNRFFDVMAGEDEREGGALLFFHAKQPLPISGSSREFPSPVTFIERARRNPEIWIDIEKPFWWDVPVWLACARIDSIGIANNHQWRRGMLDNEAWGKPRDTNQFPSPQGNGLWTQEIYYRILNCGFRIPPSAGSASGVLPNPVGYNRVYVFTGSSLDYQNWWEQLRQGRCFVSNGPLLLAQANGQLPGSVFQIPASEILELPIDIDVRSSEALARIEIVQDGTIVHSIPIAETHFRGKRSIQFKGSGWFLVRAIARDPTTFRFASTAPFYVELKTHPTRVSKSSSQFFLDWVRERKQRVQLADAAPRTEVLRYHERAEAFWREKVAQANVP